MAFGPYGGQYFHYFFRESLTFGPCILFTTDTIYDPRNSRRRIHIWPVASGDGLSEYDALVQWRRPVIRLHVSREFPAALDQLLHVFKQALHRMSALMQAFFSFRPANESDIPHGLFWRVMRA
jgi:hypothetical protein